MPSTPAPAIWDRAKTLFHCMRVRIQSVAARGANRRALAAAQLAIAGFPVNQGRRHDLPGQLIVSLTSYPARFPTLALTLKSILDQTIKADRSVLWIAREDIQELPDAVTQLKAFGLEILPCEDLRSYKKLIPSLEMWPDSFIVTADDDCYYSPTWLETLAYRFDVSCPAIVAWQANRPRRLPSGQMARYLDWQFGIVDPSLNPTDGSIMPVGVGGILYFPGSLAIMTTDKSLFQELAPHGDDLWLYWMGRLASSRYLQVGLPFRQILWEDSQVSSLFHVNAAGRNDAQVQALEAKFGFV